MRWREASKVVGGETEGGKLRHSMVREAVGRQGSVRQTVAVGNLSHPSPTMRNQLLHCAGLLTHSSHSLLHQRLLLTHYFIPHPAALCARGGDLGDISDII